MITSIITHRPVSQHSLIATASHFLQNKFDIKPKCHRYNKVNHRKLVLETTAKGRLTHHCVDNNKQHQPRVQLFVPELLVDENDVTQSHEHIQHHGLEMPTLDKTLLLNPVHKTLCCYNMMDDDRKMSLKCHQVITQEIQIFTTTSIMFLKSWWPSYAMTQFTSDITVTQEGY